jgi:hypothetical protein
MSPTDAVRFTDTPTPTHPAGPPTPAPPGGDHTLAHSAVGEGSLATDSRPSRPVPPAPVSPSRNVQLHPSNDPCNYLG